jgi:hypothetical protein
MTEAVDESGGPKGSKAKDRKIGASGADQEVMALQYAPLNFSVSFVKVMIT